jgi:flagellar basal-body rod protein FlgB
MKVEDTTIKALMTSMNFRQMRQELITSNIANAETPGYKAKRLNFEQALARAIDVDGQLKMKSGDERHFDVGSGGFANLEPTVENDANGVVSEDGNTVDAEQELAKMEENRILYDAAVQLLNRKLGLLKYTVQSER